MGGVSKTHGGEQTHMKPGGQGRRPSSILLGKWGLEEEEKKNDAGEGPCRGGMFLQRERKKQRLSSKREDNSY